MEISRALKPMCGEMVQLTIKGRDGDSMSLDGILSFVGNKRIRIRMPLGAELVLPNQEVKQVILAPNYAVVILETLALDRNPYTVSTTSHMECPECSLGAGIVSAPHDGYECSGCGFRGDADEFDRKAD